MKKFFQFYATVALIVALTAQVFGQAAGTVRVQRWQTDTSPSSWKNVDMPTYNGAVLRTSLTGIPELVAPGTQGQVWTMQSGLPRWAASTSSAGGYPVASITALKAVSVSGLTTGYPVRVTDLDRVFTYNSADARPGNNVTIVTPDVGSGRWDLVTTVNDYNKNFTTQGRSYLAHFHTLLMNGSAAKMIFSGDSTTEGGTGNGIVNPTLNNISNVVGTMMQAAYPAITTVNSGHSSQSTALWLSTYLALDLAQNPNLYVLRWGINDGSLNPDTFLSNLETGLLTIRQSKSAAQMSILLMSPNATNDNPLGRNQAWYERVVPALPILARKYQCAYIDTYSLYADAMNAITAMDAPYAGIVASTSLVNGTRYQILSVGSTDFTAVGAAANIVGVVFTATGAGSGTGTAASMVSAGSFVVGTDYTIGTIGTTDFTLIGAAYNAVGLTFTATGVGTGTGKASLGTHIHPHDVMNRWIGSQVYDMISPSGVQRGYALNNVTVTRADAATPNVADLPNSYPYGVSMGRAITAGGWILDGGIFTQRTPDDIVLQIVNNYTYSSAFKVRTSASTTTWNDWQYFINASGTSLAASATPINYQKGLGTYNVLSSNGWPVDGSVFSFIDSAGAVSQLLIDATGAFQTRQSTSSSAWSSWVTGGGAGTGTVTSVSVVTANGISGSVATATTTPAITLSLGAITPTSITTSTASLGVTALGNTTITGFVNASGAVSGATLAASGGSAPSTGTSMIYGFTSSNTPDLTFVRSTSSSDQKIWDITTGSNNILFRAVNDAYSAAGTFLSVTRSGAAIGTVSFPSLTSNGLLTTSGGTGALSITVPGTGILTALGINVGSAGAPVVFNSALGTPSSGTVTNLTGTASININGTVGATTPGTGAFTTISTSSTLTASTTIELGNASDTTLSRVSAGVMAVEGVTVATSTNVLPLTNKRVTARVTTITSSATPTVVTDDCDCVTITALAAAITSMTTNLSGTPANFDQLEYRIKDDGTARAITWGASFAAGPVALPATTTISKLLHVYFEYNTVTSKWECQYSASDL